MTDDIEVFTKTVRGIKVMKRTSLELPKERERMLHDVQQILGENTTSKSLDIALRIVLNLYDNSDNLARAQLIKIVPEKYAAKFILKADTGGKKL
jgi:hypothetical protein